MRIKQILFILLIACMGAFMLIPDTEAVLQVFSSKKRIPVYSVETANKDVAITFDCAWGAQDIPEILDVLEGENVKATFFIVGLWAEKYPETVKIISDAGHDIANHGYAHLRMGLLEESKIDEDISKCDRVLYSITNKKPDLFRPPYGDYDNEVIETAESLKYFTIQWDVDSLDWKNTMSASDIIERVTGRCRNGSIILFHNDTKHTVNVLPEIIKSLKSQGFGFEPVSKMILRENYTIDHMGRQRNVE
ncbi:MAG: polysaccharide deacetylase family protein [Eubacteriales bacterium]|nr:polysaccharide deacetylase family protein [Eubacteriales bacterium]